ncbi:MAG: NADH-quinone oxidoreductase subunit N [Candidatus Gastranaerophilales bacterium]|nr:NADH-quinone oxidoreductase subunit N [Candidatus Gastranaerophilales bacterium]
MEFLNNITKIMLPEILLIVFIFIQIILSMFSDTKFYKLSKWLTVLGIFLAISLCSKVSIDPIYYGFKNSIISDNYTIFFKFLILLSSFLIVFLTKKVIMSRRDNAFRFNALLLTVILGSLILVSANDFLTMFIAMETLGFGMFFLIAFEKGHCSKEATLKYLVISAVASAVFLFGVSYMYGITGSVNFSSIYDYFLNNNPTLLYSMAAIFITCGLAFKLGVIPFANWILDVYEGANTSVVTFLSIVPKVAMFGILARLLVFPLSYSFELTFILVVISVATAIWANCLAIRQKNIKRLLACSSSANASYVLFAAALVSVFNLSTVLFYLVAYIFMNIGVFAAVIILESSEFSNKLYEFKNFAYTNPVFTLCFATCIFGLAGFPITAGFISKIYLFSAISRSGLIFLPFLMIMMLTIVVSVYYYLRVVKFMFEKSDNVTSEVIPHKVSSAIVILYCCAAITVILGICPSKIIEICQLMAYNI